MNGWRYALGFVYFGSLVGALGFTASRLRGRYLSSWAGPLAVLADIVIALWVLVVMAQLLGALGLLRPIPLFALALVLAVACSLTMPRTGTDHTGEELSTAPSPPFSVHVAVAVAIAGGALVVRRWWGPTRDVILGQGVVGYDSLWTHLPFAANIFQQGSILGSYFPGSLPETYLPLNSELLHSVGMVVFRSDLLSPLFSLGWAVLGLLAAWSFAARWNVAPLGLLSAAIVLDLPVFLNTQPGQAMNDVAVLSLLLCSLAFSVHADGCRAALVLAAAAAGLAMGTQVTSLLVVIVLAVMAVLLCQRQQRWTGFALCGLALVSTGGLWYARNAVLVGNPLPWLKLGLGDFRLPAISSSLADCGNDALIDRWSDQGFRKSVLAPALATGLGPKWVIVVVLAVAGLIGGVVLLGPGCRRVPVIVGTAALVSYVLTPATAGRPANAFHCTSYNTRFVVFGLASGLLCLAAVVSRDRRVASTLLVAMVVLLLQYDSDSGGSLLARWAFLIAVTLVVLALLRWGRRERLPHPPPRWRVMMLIALGMVAAAVVWPAADRYAARRYTGSTLPPSVRVVASWAQKITGSRVAVAGTFMSYPLFGPDMSNRVVHPHVESRRGVFELADDCTVWRALLREGRYDYVVVVAEGSTSEPPEAAWTAGDPGAEPVLRDGLSTVFRFDPNAPDTPCTT